MPPLVKVAASGSAPMIARLVETMQLLVDHDLAPTAGVLRIYIAGGQLSSKHADVLQGFGGWRLICICLRLRTPYSSA